MAIPSVVASLDQAPEKFRTDYRKGDDGRFYLDVENVDEMPAVSGLKNKVSQLLDEKKKLEQAYSVLGSVEDLQKMKTQLSAFGDLTPEKIEELKKKADGRHHADVEIIRREAEAKITQISENAAREVKKAQEDAESANRAASDFYAGEQIASALAKTGGSTVLLEHVMRDGVQVKRDNGKFSISVVDAKGNARFKDSQGNAMTLVDYALELKKNPEYAPAFQPSKRSGSGSEGGGDGSPSGGTSSFDRSDPLAWGQNAEKIVKGEAFAG